MICVEETKEMTDLSEREDIIWLTPEEFDIKQLTYLFGGSSKRRKDANSLFPHLKDRIYRCREFPNGIYINKFGELCPQDSRSGVYQEIEPDMKPDSDCEDDSEDPDNDESKDSADEAWAKEEEKVKQKQSKKRKRAEESEDEDYEKSEESEADEDMSDAEETLSDAKEDDEIMEEEEDDDWQPSKKKAKKNNNNKQIVIEDSDSDSRSEDSESEEDKEDEEVIESKEEKIKVPQPTTVVEDLKSSVELVEHYNNIENRRRLERLRTDKLIHYLETLTEEWAIIAKEKKRKTKGQKNGGKPIKMSYESELLCKDPTCQFVFRKAGSKVKGGVTADLDCAKTNLICMCGKSDFQDTTDIYDHVESHFPASVAEMDYEEAEVISIE